MDNKKAFNFTTLFIIVYVILAIIILIVIWFPKSSKKENKIIKYENVNVDKKEIELYQSELKRLLKEENSKELYAKMNLEFLQKNNLTKDNFDEYLKNSHLTGDNIVVIESSISKQSDNTYTYKFSYRTNGLTKHVNVMETSPYNYTISFEISEIPVANDRTLSTVVDNVEFRLKQVGITDTVINYRLEIINDSTYNVEYNFNDIDNVLLMLKNNNYVKLTTAVVDANNIGTLTPNSKLTKDFFFPVGNNYQDNIKSFILRNIKIGEENKNITINI